MLLRPASQYGSRPSLCHFFVVCNIGCPVECRTAQEVRQESIEFYRQWCVRGPGLCWKVLVGRTVLQQVFHCHWSCPAGAHCRMTTKELDEHVMSESAVTCPHFHNNHLVFPRKEDVHILSVVLRMLLKPSSPLPVFYYYVTTGYSF